MARKRSGLLRGSCVTRLGGAVLTLVVLGTPVAAHADGGATPIVATRVPGASVGVPVKTSITVTGGTRPYVFDVIAGAPPAGLTLARDGVLSGTPTEGGTSRFTVRVTDSSSLRATVLQSYVMIVQGRPDPSFDPNTIALMNQQATAARRFALAQITNVQTRLQALRATNEGRCMDGGGASWVAPAPTRAAPGSMPLEAPAQPDRSFSLPMDNCRTLPDRTTTLWTAGALDIGTTGAQAGGNGFRFDSQGVTLGGDYGVRSDFAFGAGVGFARDDSQLAPPGGASSSAFANSLSGYLSYRPLDICLKPERSSQLHRHGYT